MSSSTSRIFSGSTATAAGTTDDMFEIVLANESKVAIEINPVTNALDAFEIHVKAHVGGTYVRVASAAADFTTPKGFIAAASGDVTTQGAGTFGCVVVQHLEACYSIKVKASSAVGAGTLNWKATASQPV